MLSIRSIQPTQNNEGRLQKAFLLVLSFTLLLWVIKILSNYFGLEYWKLGVFPGEAKGLIGIITAPLIHGSFSHLISNTPAIIILGTALLFGYPKSWPFVLPIIWIVSGLGVWFTARPVYHFGASGLTYGLMAFVFLIGILRRDRLAIILSLIVFFLYGTMIWGLFPHLPGVSFETHLWGAGVGCACAILFRNRDEPLAEKHYDWENEDDESNDWGLEYEKDEDNKF